MTRHMVPMLAALTALAAGCSGGSPTAGARAGGARAVPVEVAEVTRGTIRQVARFSGTFSARSQFAVAPKVAGRMKRLCVDIGDRVAHGQLLAELDDEEYAQALAQSKAEVKVSEASVLEANSALEAVRREFDRVKALRAKQIISEAELDGARSEYDAREARYRLAVAQVEQRRAAMAAAEIRLSYTRISAPWEEDGGLRVVGERFVHEGAMLAANTPICTVLEVGTLLAVVYVVDREYAELAVGARATLSVDSLPGRTFTGSVARKAPLIREGSRQARVEIEVPNPDGVLSPGMFVRADVELAAHENALMVPIAALARREGRQGVFQTQAAAPDPSGSGSGGGNQAPPTAKFVPVTIGIVEGELAEVLEPKIAGHVITVGQHLLEEGAPVRLPGARASTGGASR